MNEKIANGIDWRATKARLDRAQRSIETAFLPDMEHTGELLRTRARSLAVRGVRNSGDASHTPVLIFRLMGMHYGIDLGALSRMGEWAAPSPVPGSNAALLGLTTSRGAAWALFDLGRVISSEQKTK
ncbi:MAG: chemotaxis protein CheW, partial [Nisaea sp.]|uniref:chemotaxis protein CheW n=1 Tax=Nisaea sp. TaxID=2024842 RepID=UPI003263A2A5